MVEEIFTFEGRTSGTAQGGTVQLDADVVVNPVSFLQIPPGMVLKVWAKRVSGLGSCTFIWSYSFTAASGTNYTEVSRDTFPGPTGGASEFSVEKKRPMIFRGVTGTEGIQLTWIGASPTGGTVNAIEFEAIYGNDVLDEPLW